MQLIAWQVELTPEPGALTLFILFDAYRSTAR